MRRRSARSALFACGLAAVAALPLVARGLRADGGDRCALDGIPVAPATRVRIVDAEGRTRLFCCVDCAHRWLAGTGGRTLGIHATDETTGAEVGAAEAWFVESRVPAFPACGSNIHAFAREADARRHATEFGGVVLGSDERPLRTKEADVR